MKTILAVIGTRPEAIKMAPVIQELRAASFDVAILATGQHRELLDLALKDFDLSPRWNLEAMVARQGLSSLVARILPDLENVIQTSKAVAVVAQGDTSTVFASALAAFHAKVPFAHVEAGLRSGDLGAPFPEEGNRRLVSVLTRWHFAPTQTARQQLLHEGINDAQIHVVGNTVIDSLLKVASRNSLPWPDGIPMLRTGQKSVLITLHRRENFGEPFARILNELRQFAEANEEIRFIYPVHPNPNVLEPARRILSGLPNVSLTAPLAYLTLVNVLRQSFAVFTDSGGLQEEAPALGKPVLVFREVTERPEAVAAGGVVLVGSDPVKFRAEARSLFGDADHYASMAVARFPYGKGDSSIAIARRMTQDLNV